MWRAASWLCGMALLASTAQAQGTVVPVAERMAADHAPLGARAGAFLIIPRFELDEAYRSNIYAVQTRPKSDRVMTARPEIAVKSGWSRHALNMLAKATVNRYAAHGRENTTDTTIALDGRLDVRHATSVGGGVAWRHGHEERGDPESPASLVEPQQFDMLVAKLGAYRGRGRLNARFDSEVRHYDYKDNYTIGGLLVHASLRNRTAYIQSLRLGYRLDPRFEVFVRGVVDSRVYAAKQPLNRSSHGQAYVAGATFDITGKTSGEVYAGLMRRRYAGGNGTQAPTYGAKAMWNASGLTTVVAALERAIEETALGASTGYVATRASLGLQHALTRRLLLRGDVEVASNAYRGATAFQRRDMVWTAEVGAAYYLNRFLKAGVHFSQRQRASNVAGGDYRSHGVLISLSATY